MPIKINVPFEKKEEAKKLGAFWMPDARTWIIPDHVADIDPFKAWLPANGGSIVKYPHLIIKSSRSCWKCHEETPLIALGARKYFTTAFSSPENIEWEKREYPAFFVDIRYIDPEVTGILKESYPFFREMYAKKLETNTWVNTCIHCSTIQGDEYNTADPGAPFGGYMNEKKTLFRGKETELLHLRFDYYLDASVYEGDYYWDGFNEAE